MATLIESNHEVNYLDLLTQKEVNYSVKGRRRWTNRTVWFKKT